MHEFLAAKGRKIKKPQDVEAMIDGHDDDIAALGKTGAIRARRVG